MQFHVFWIGTGSIDDMPIGIQLVEMLYYKYHTTAPNTPQQWSNLRTL